MSSEVAAKEKKNQSSIIDEFIDTIWLQNGLSKNTLNAYRTDLNKTAQWLKETKNKELTKVGREDLLDYLDYTKIASLTIKNCPALSFCEVQSICNYLENNIRNISVICKFVGI